MYEVYSAVVVIGNVVLDKLVNENALVFKTMFNCRNLTGIRHQTLWPLL